MGDLQVNFKEGISGNSNDITDFLKTNNIDLSNYFKQSPGESARKAFKNWYFFILVIPFIIALFLCYFYDKSSPVFMAASLSATILLVIIIFCIHLKFDKLQLTLIAIVGGIILLSISLRVNSMGDIVDKSGEIIESQFNNNNYIE